MRDMGNLLPAKPAPWIRLFFGLVNLTGIGVSIYREALGYLPAAALIASSSTACSKLTVSGFMSRGSVALSLPCCT